ncbi:Protein of unknown function [Bacillus wiedmannii]|nr:Protein of unknown function [Bacillus wiedmannii]
MEEESC